MMNTNFHDQAQLRGTGQWQAPGLLDKYRVQVPIILCATLSIQLLIEFFGFGAQWLSSTLETSLLVTFFANTASLVAYRNMRNYPGARKVGFLITSFIIAYGLSALFLLGTRVPYSARQFVIGGLCALVISGAFAVMRKQAASQLFIVPSERTESLLASLPGLPHKICHTPDQILDPSAIVVVDLHRDISQEWEKAIANATLLGATIYHVRFVREALTGKVAITHLSENTFGSLAPNSVFFLIKRIGDRVVGLIALLLLAPFLVLAMLAVVLDSRGPAIYRQRRIGYRGKPFTIWKLRTMEHRVGKGDRKDAMTMENDPRITRVGRFFRHTRIDELPQLINVVKGEMSIIGPRPEAVELGDWYNQSIDFYPYRHVVMPGITGWAQVKQGHVAEPEEVYHKLQYDFYYIKHFSLWLDLVILLKTVGVVIGKFGAK